MISDANPYNPLLPTENPEYFINRNDVFAFFRQNLVGTPHRHAIALIGWRGLGKSSVLHQLQVDDRYRVCFVPLGSYDLPGETELIAALVDEIRLMLEQAEVSTLRLPTWPDEQTGEELRDWFNREYLTIVLAALRHRRLLLILDDAHGLLAGIERGILPNDLLGYLTDLLGSYDRLDIICAVDASYEDQALTTDLLRDPALHLRLTELERDDAERLILDPVQDVYSYDLGVMERILALAGGHPFLIHSICRLLFRRSEERNHNGPVTDRDLDAIDTAVLEQADEIFSPLWQNAPRNERLALSALVALQQPDGASMPFDAIYGWLTSANFVLNKTQLAAALRGLEYKGLVKMDQVGSYRLPADLIAAWVRANATLPEENKPNTRPQMRWLPLAGLILVLLLAAGLGAGAVLGLYGDDSKDSSNHKSNQVPTATLSLNLDATRESVEATQTQAARPTATRTPTLTPTATDTPTITPSPTRTPRPTITPTATPTLTPSETATPTALPTNTPRPSRTPTLNPG